MAAKASLASGGNAPQGSTKSRFSAALLRPADPQGQTSWAFVLLPRAVSDTLPRRGRTTVKASINGQAFQAMLEPDGKLSHWLKVEDALCQAAGLHPGDSLTVEIAPLAKEPEPRLPADLEQALAAAPEARRNWEATTTLARVDWIHWIESAKQAKTRASRVESACDMLGAGKKRVCCFDPSGYYSKGLRAPKAAE